MQPNKKILEFINKHHVLSLSMILPDHQLWACNAFYVFNEDSMSLYILSDVKTIHGNAMLTHSHVAGTISIAPKTVAKIQGIQFQAIASQLADHDATQAYSHYYRKFPFARMIKAPIWSLKLQRIKMTNNLMGFAHKTHWVRTVE